MVMRLVYRAPSGDHYGINNGRACVPLAALSDDVLWVRFLPWEDGSGANVVEPIPCKDLKWERQGLPRERDGSLSPYAWPGGYPIFYLNSKDEALCPACANVGEQERDPDAWPDDRPVIAGINYEDPSLDCERCGERIPSAYAEDDDV